MKQPALIHHAEDLASKLPALMVEAERVAQTVAQGIHGRRRTGQGDSFWQFRPYQQGESTHRIDWRQSAKTQNHFIREHEWEAAQTIWLWCDRSPSMGFSGDKNRPDKRHRAEILTLAIASLLVRGGEQIALMGDPNPPSNGHAALHRLASIFEQNKDNEQGVSLPAHQHLSQHSELILIGDFLSPLSEIEDTLKRYNQRNICGHLLQVLDPVEETLPFEGRVEFEGMENEGRITFGNVDSIRDDYRARLSARRAALTDLTHALGWGFHLHRTNQSAESALMTLYQSITHGGKTGV